MTYKKRDLKGLPLTNLNVDICTDISTCYLYLLFLLKESSHDSRFLKGIEHR